MESQQEAAVSKPEYVKYVYVIDRPEGSLLSGCLSGVPFFFAGSAKDVLRTHTVSLHGISTSVASLDCTDVTHALERISTVGPVYDLRVELSARGIRSNSLHQALHVLAALDHTAPAASPLIDWVEVLAMARSSHVVVSDELLPDPDVAMLVMLAFMGGIPVSLIVSPNSPLIPHGMLVRGFSEIVVRSYGHIEAMVAKIIERLWPTASRQDP